MSPLFYFWWLDLTLMIFEFLYHVLSLKLWFDELCFVPCFVLLFRMLSCSGDHNDLFVVSLYRKRLFSLINDLPTLFEVITGRKPSKDKPSMDSGSKSRNSTKVKLLISLTLFWWMMKRIFCICLFLGYAYPKLVLIAHTCFAEIKWQTNQEQF